MKAVNEMARITDLVMKENFRLAVKRSVKPLRDYMAWVSNNYSRFDNPDAAFESCRTMGSILKTSKAEINRIEEMFEELDK